MENTLGTNSIKTMLDFVLKVLNQVITLDDNKDGKVGLSEMLSLATTISFSFPQVAKAYPDLKPEVRDLTADELGDLVGWFQTNFDLDLPSDKVEIVVRKVVNAIYYNYRTYRELRDELATAA